jgi:D-tyrosyl-tRNA(Tyr) deacylase
MTGRTRPGKPRREPRKGETRAGDLARLMRINLILTGMRAVIQRVSRAGVTINHAVRGRIEKGLLVLLAVEEADGPEDIEWLSGKIVRLRIFPDDHGVMNRSVQEMGGDILVISQFTLFASTKKGNRPSYIRSAGPPIAVPLYEKFVERLGADLGKPVQTGEFGADMQVELVNDGPVTIIIDSKVRE